MPLYEYRCNDCQRTVEVIQKFSDADLTQCEACGGQLEKLLSAPAIHFKGSGWYITDYARKNSAGSAANGASGASAGSGGESGGGESAASPAAAGADSKAEKPTPEKKSSEKKSSQSSPKVA